MRSPVKFEPFSACTILPIGVELRYNCNLTKDVALSSNSPLGLASPVTVTCTGPPVVDIVPLIIVVSIVVTPFNIGPNICT